MAKRTRASAREKPASAGSPEERIRRNDSKSARNAAQKETGHKIAAQISRTAKALKARLIVFTPEALAHARYRYEHTEASLADIAVDLRVARDTVRNLARSNGWARYVRPPRGLTPAVQLNAQASEVEARRSARRCLVFPKTQTRYGKVKGLARMAQARACLH